MPGSIYVSPSRDFVFVRIKISRCEDAFPVWAMHPLTARILHQQQPHFVHQISTISTRKKTQGPLPWNLFRIFIIDEISTHNRICTCLYPSCTAVCATTSIIGPGYRPTCTGSPLHLHRRTWHLGLSLVPKTSGCWVL